MLGLPLPDRLALFAGALQNDDAEAGLTRAMALLSEMGIVQAAPDERAPWLSVAHGSRTLSFDAVVGGDSALDVRTRDLIGASLRAAMMRAAEAAEHARTRERLDMLSAASFEGLFVHVDGVIVDANHSLTEMLGYTREELLGANIVQLCVVPEDWPDVLHRVTNRVEGEYIVTAVRKDGAQFRAELQTKQGRIGERPVRVVAVRDVTGREKTNMLLAESERRFRELTDAAFDFTVFTRGGIVLDARGDVERVLGVGRDTIVGRPVLDFVATSAQPVVQHAMSDNRFGAYDAAALNAQGAVVPIQCVVVASTLDGQSVRAVGLRDLRPTRRVEAERRTLEQQVERAQRLESLGVLAGGIAHDFNNLLAGILGNAELLDECATTADAREGAQAIIAAAQRAAALTRQMLAYAGQRDLGRREPVDIGAVVRELGSLLEATLSKKARLELDIGPGTVVVGERTTIDQVVMNLLTNASDALGDQPGEIRVRARCVQELDGRWDGALGSTIRPGDWVLIEVSDTGVGMDELTRGRVFEPFFSTKEKGHGLGLAACLGIVSAHGGAVLVESELGRGSRFSVVLPASDVAVTAGEKRLPPAGAKPCHVMVVDDEALVRTQLRRTLELRGYTVEEAGGGRAALAALAAKARADLPEVIILDMTMPDLDGAETLRAIRAAGVEVPVVISSGYLDLSIERRLPRGAFQGFLAKPYGATDLVGAIERALAAPATMRPSS
jgi:two-component system cell cycle sensor histidine kinase/response regulator CckA